MKTFCYRINEDKSVTHTVEDRPDTELAVRAKALAAQHPGQIVCGLQMADRGEVKFDRVDLLDNMTGGGEIKNDESSH